ncbi:MAG: ShlB/FhaC/HecB family hemolysin secretion/activation protein [Gemmatimonadales bacterium]
MARHESRDAAVTDYRARIRYRLSAALGRRRWARLPTTAVEEQEAMVAWSLPNDLRVDVVGRRFRTRDGVWDFSSVFDRPWFVPRDVDDSLRIFSDRFPWTGALHPLAAEGPAWYRYSLLDSLSVTPAGGSPVRVYLVEAVPRRAGPALVAGRLWIEADSSAVVRMVMRYVGTELFERRGTERFVSVDVDLEYALLEGRHWMPFRQTIAGRVRVPMLDDLVVPFQAVTTFHDYEINAGRTIAFELPLPDSTSSRDSVGPPRRQRTGEGARGWNVADRWPGGRFELHRPSDDSLERYAAWDDSLSVSDVDDDNDRIREAEALLAQLADSLPPDITGERAQGVSFEKPSDPLRYDRVQGWSFGFGYRLRVPAIEFAGVQGTIRYGISDERVSGRLSFVRDAPTGRLAVSGYRDVVDVDPISRGQTVGNTLNAIFAAHDNADYMLVTGGSASLTMSLATGWDLAVSGRVERQRSVVREAASDVNDFFGGDGIFPENAPITEGTFGGGTVTLSGTGATRWSLTADGLGGEGLFTTRFHGEIRRAFGGRRGATIRAKAGIATATDLGQMQFRAGGVNTVRGFDYATLRGRAFWAAQLDVTPIAGRLRPVLFADAGRASAPGELFEGRVLVGAGVGLSVFGGLLRFDLSRRLSPGDGTLRFDVTAGAPR